MDTRNSSAKSLPANVSWKRPLEYIPNRAKRYELSRGYKISDSTHLPNTLKPLSNRLRPMYGYHYSNSHSTGSSTSHQVMPLARMAGVGWWVSSAATDSLAARGNFLGGISADLRVVNLWGGGTLTKYEGFVEPQDPGEAKPDKICLKVTVCPSCTQDC